MHVSKKALEEIEAALGEYEKEVELSNMTVSTKQTYLLHSANFVKWLKGEFTPGARKQ
ncbi:MAG TPA: hypothetical protein VMG31_05775 [Verrucomicrobiae bacterium]|nr:hypothetical protein [Verrucomicrobiae bacterium]